MQHAIFGIIIDYITTPDTRITHTTHTNTPFAHTYTRVRLAFDWEM